MTNQKSPQNDDDKSVTPIATIIAAISLLISTWVGVSYWNLRNDYVALKSDYLVRVDILNELAKQAVELSDQVAAARSPKLKVINFLEIATKLPGVDVNTPEGLEQGFLKMQKLAAEYAAQGYVLIDADAVVSAPESMKLGMKELLGQ